MKYDCPKCARSLKGEGWSLWMNWREKGKFTFTCPLCNAPFRISVHRVEVGTALVILLIMVGFSVAVAVHKIEPLEGPVMWLVIALAVFAPSLAR